MERVERVLKSLLLAANDFRIGNDTQGSQIRAKNLMRELMQLTGLTYQAAEELLINWIENPKSLEELT